MLKTAQGTVAVTFAEFPAIRLTSGQAGVSGSVDRITMEPSATHVEAGGLHLVCFSSCPFKKSGLA